MSLFTRVFRDETKTVLNGVQLPPEFTGGSTIGNVAISADKKRYAYVGPNKELKSGPVPKNGHINAGGVKTEFKDGVPSQASDSGFAFEAKFFGTTVTLRGGLPKQVFKEQKFAGITSVSIESSVQDLSFSRSDSKAVVVDGECFGAPRMSKGQLVLKNFGGNVALPSSVKEVKIKTISGDISGVLGAAGTVESSAGNVDLTVASNLSILTEVNLGEANIIGFVSNGNGKYAPLSSRSKGLLSIKSGLVGNINVAAAD